MVAGDALARLRDEYVAILKYSLQPIHRRAARNGERGFLTRDAPPQDARLRVHTTTADMILIGNDDLAFARNLTNGLAVF